MSGNPISAKWRGHLQTTLDTARLVEAVLADVLENGEEMSKSCAERKVGYLRMRNFCQRFAQFAENKKKSPVNLSKDFPPTFAEKFYAECFYVDEAEVYKIMPDDAEESIEAALSTLKPREADMIRRYFNGETFESIGLDYNLSRERVRQITRKALRQLRHPARVKVLTLGVEALEEAQAEYERIKAETAKSAEHIREEIKRETERLLCTDVEYRNNAILLAMPASELVKLPIEALNLSVRPFNVLKRRDIRTLNDILNIGRDKLMSFPNMGRKSFEEIICKLAAFGITL